MVDLLETWRPLKLLITLACLQLECLEVLALYLNHMIQ